MAQLISLIIGYFIGAIVQTSYWYGRRKKVDIRNYGSGNAGTTNAMRTLGRKAGIITAVGDVAKVFLSALISWLIFRNSGLPTMLIFLYSGLGTVVGHNFPFFMKFKGGKGVATTAGVIISLFFLPNACWVMTLIGAITFFGVLILTRYASVASLALVTEFLIEFLIWSGSGNTELRGGAHAQGVCIVIIITALCYLRHLGNIERLIDGRERRFGEKANVSRSGGRKSAETAQPVRHNNFKRSAEEEKYYSEDYSEAYRPAPVRKKRKTSEQEEFYTDEIYREEMPEADETFTEDSFAKDRYTEDISVNEEMSADKRPSRDTSPVRKVDEEEIKAREEEGRPRRNYIWDAEKQCYVRYKDYEGYDE